jgi:hypothetical protein
MIQSENFLKYEYLHNMKNLHTFALGNKCNNYVIRGKTFRFDLVNRQIDGIKLR